MKKNHQIFALAAAFYVLASALPQMPVRYRSAAGERRTLLDFARDAAEHSKNRRECFSALSFRPDEQQLYRDGTAVGSSFGGFAVRNGAVCIDAETVGIPAEGWLTPEEAAPYIGCEVRELDGETAVVSPFQSGRLIVKSDGTPETYGGITCAEGYRSLHVLQYDSPAAAYSAYQSLCRDDSVIYVEPDRTLHICEEQEDDPQTHWGADAIEAAPFLEELRMQPDPAPEIRVAVIDTGIYPEHTMFQDRIAEGGRCFVEQYSEGYLDRQGHGTHCAGIICSVTNENVHILPLKALNDEGQGSSLEVYCAMMYAAEQGVDLCSMSLGGVGESQLLNEASAYLYEQGIPVVVAAGNERTDVQYIHPACTPENITVTALEQADDSYTLALYSNTGGTVDFAAPGSDIYSAGNTSPTEMVYKSGTSMATPFVAGCVADLLSYDPSLTVDEICETLRRSAVDLGDTGYDELYGWGMVSLSGLRFPNDTGVRVTTDLPSGVYNGAQNVKLKCGNPNAEIRYTADGTKPDAETGILFDGTPICIEQDTVLAAVAVTQSGISRPYYFRYEIGSAVPSAEPAGGYYMSAQEVSLEAEGAEAIYYTLDGSEPADGVGTLYTGTPIVIENTCPLKAVSVSGKAVSSVMSEDYLISGTPADALYDVEDGVLKQYHGSAAYVDLMNLSHEITLTAIGPSAFRENPTLEILRLPASVRTVEEAAFADCKSLKSVTAFGLTEIGDFAFSGCTELTNAAFEWTKIRSIGSRAFYGVPMNESTKITLIQIEFLGDYAFAETGKIRFADIGSLKEIPEGAFYASGAQMIFGQNPVTVGDYAFAVTPEFVSENGTRQLQMYLEELRQAGAHAFENCMLNTESFPQLTQAGAYAFAGTDISALYCDVLKDVPEHLTDGSRAKVLSFAGAETIGSSAVAGTAAYFVTGEDLRDLAPDAVTIPMKTKIIVGSEKTPAEQFAADHGKQFRLAPYFILESSEITTTQFGYCSVPYLSLGGEGDAEWRRFSDETCTLPMNGKWETTGSFLYPDTSAAGESYYAVGSGTGDRWTRISEPVKVTVQEKQPEGWIQPQDGYYLLNRSAKKQDDSTAAVGFVPEQDGVYYFGAEQCEAMHIYVQETGAVIEPKRLGSSSLLSAGMELQAGSEIRIFVAYADQCEQALLTVRKALPEISLDDCVLHDLGQPYVYSGTPVVPQLALEYQGKDSDITLTENTDYIVWTPDFQSSGESGYTVFGIGSCYGAVSGTIHADGKITDGGVITMDLNDNTERLVRFVPEQTGTYGIWTEHTEAELQRLKTEPNASSKLNSDFELRVLDTESGQYVYGSAANQTSRPCLTMKMEAGKAYDIGLTANDPNIRAVLHVRKDAVRQIRMIQPQSELSYHGEPIFPQFDVTDENGQVLDSSQYEICYLNNDAPGILTAVFRSKGDCYGECWNSWYVDFDPTEFDAVRIAPGAPFVMTERIGVFQFVLNQTKKMQLKCTDGQVQDYIASFSSVQNGDPNVSVEFVAYGAAQAEAGFSLYEAAYYLLIDQKEAGTHEYLLSAVDDEKQAVDLASPDIDIVLADVQATGMPVAPQVEIRYRGELLEEGRDYYLVYDSGIIDCGIYPITVMGMGSTYFGSVTRSFRVCPDPAGPAYPQITEEETTVTLTQPKRNDIRIWKATCSEVCLWTENYIGTDIVLADENMNEICRCSGFGLCCEWASVQPGKTYYVIAGFYHAEETGSFVYHLTDRYRSLAACAADYQRWIPASKDGAVPSFTLTDGDYTLREGVDYEVRYTNGSKYMSRARICLQGKGNYLGYKYLDYYPVPDYDTVCMEQPNVLEVDVSFMVKPDVPDTLHAYIFTAPETRIYYLQLPEPEMNPVVAFVYSEDGTFLTCESRCVKLNAGESIRIAVVSQVMEDVADLFTEVEIRVQSDRGMFQYSTDQIVWAIYGDAAYLVDLPNAEDGSGVYLPDHITDETEFIDAAFIGDMMMFQRLYQLQGTLTIYCEKGGPVERWCMNNDLCYAIVDAVYTKPGDVTGNGVVDRFDAQTLMRWMAENPGMQLSEDAFRMADMDTDGAITVNDVFLILSEC